MKSIHNKEEFEEAVALEGISIFTFSADWCPDCRFIEPFMPALVKRYQNYRFYYVDRDECIEICQDLMVMGIPSFVAYKEHKEIARFVSKMRKTEVEIDAFFAGLQN